MIASRCPYCGGRTEPSSETWEAGGRLLRVRRCVSCGRETTLESAWPGRLPPSATVSGVRLARGALWVGGGLAIFWVVLRRLADYGDRLIVYNGIKNALEAFRSPLWIGVIVVVTSVVVWRGRRGRGGGGLQRASHLR